MMNLRITKYTLSFFIFFALQTNHVFSGNHDIRCWDLELLNEQGISKRVVHINFNGQVGEEDYITLGEEYTNVTPVLTINYDANPAIMAMLLTVGNNNISEIDIANVNNMDDLDYSLSLYREIFNRTTYERTLFPSSNSSIHAGDDIDNIWKTSVNKRTTTLDEELLNQVNQENENQMNQQNENSSD